MNTKSKECFFSVPAHLILLDAEVPYDIYINSSTHESRDKFVRIFKSGGILAKHEVKEFLEKYFQLYIPEEQRNNYLLSLVKNDDATDLQKTEVIKDSAIKYLDKLFDENTEFTTEILTEAIKGCRDSVESMVDVIQDKSVADVRELIGNLSFHDFYTYDHSINVSMYNIATLKVLKPNANRRQMVHAGLGGMLHDLGKIRIPTAILNHPGKLSDEEFGKIKQHPHYGGEIIEAQIMSNAFDEGDIDFGIVKRVVLEHHENFNGTGYPKGLEGNQIHVLARITAISDFFDALTTKRSYHEVVTNDEAIRIMSRSVGKKLDGKLFDIFVDKVSKGAIVERATVELPDSFDPCQPQNVLPFEKVKAQKQASNIFGDKKQEDFGKIKTQEDLFNARNESDSAADPKKSDKKKVS
jgi:HD-GYP domain-containing protein (c-di-GMP phosphodiesterase class II)